MKFALILLTGLLVFVPATAQHNRLKRLEKKAMKRTEFIPGLFREWSRAGTVKVDSVIIDEDKKILELQFSPTTTQIPVRTDWLTDLEAKTRKELGRRFRDYDIRLMSRSRELGDYIPNAYRGEVSKYDLKRTTPGYNGIPLVTRLDQQQYEKGLLGRHIAIWPSHGLFFDQQLDRWQWQRARLWQTVEDIFPWSFTSAYLVPMLENSGAIVLLPRERDTQSREVIVDNNGSTGGSLLRLQGSWDSSSLSGFQMIDTIFPGVNPFLEGSGLSALVHPAGPAPVAEYIPDIPESGEYAVTVSYPNTGTCRNGVVYTVHYSGGIARFMVNQCMARGTWVYLGTFRFAEGIDTLSGYVTVEAGAGEGIMGTDAVRFGGGMGNVARKPGTEVTDRQRSSVPGAMPVTQLSDTGMYHYMISGRPRWMEGSRYYLQYAGFPDSITYNLSMGKNDYNDDYMSRPEWVNFMIGNSKPQYSGKYARGLNIPVDLSLAFHTDAGTTSNDSVIGTLGIYSTTRNEGIFPDGRDKLASRDLTDMVQTQIVDDIGKLVDPQWTRRGLWDREYSEAWRPVVPSMLLELLSHQNLADMRLGLDPEFKFIVARAVYKGIARYLSMEQRRQVVIQPLPPDHMAVEFTGDRKVRLTWRPVADPLEPSALPDRYKVYIQENENGFGQGIVTGRTEMEIDITENNKIYNFRVTAINAGGESFPGETVSAGIVPGSKPVLVVNGFDRVSAPAFFDKGDMAGVAWWEDEGVPYMNDFSFTGYQYDFDRNSEWIHDDNQGWGASHADNEGIAIAGNTFSFPSIHGKALLDAGYSFASVSDEVFESAGFNPGRYHTVDVIFGEERGRKAFGDTGITCRIFTNDMMKALSEYTGKGGNVFLSGAYIGTDMHENRDSSAIHFASDVLHFVWRTNHATQVGVVRATDASAEHFPEQLNFNTSFGAGIYRVESPDAIEPFGKGASRIFRYASGSTSAGTAYKGRYSTVILGFPFETITGEDQKAQLMKTIMDFFNTPIDL